MGGIKQYLAKQKDFRRHIEASPSSNLGMLIVIPAYKEEQISRTLDSLKGCKLPVCDCEIIIFINGSSNDDESTRSLNLQSYNTCLLRMDEFKTRKMRLHLMIDLDLPPKKAGVGYARKQLMDEACLRLNDVKNGAGLIVNLDADCSVDENYLVEIENFFLNEVKTEAASIHFEHDIDSEYILAYELHLRYFLGMQRSINLPFAYQTVGSAMACRALSYARVGGMNTRKAGEDFYFMHKFIKNETCGRIKKTKVLPSGRVSDRVPFGTGRAVGEMMQGKAFKTYNYDSFIIIGRFVEQLEDFYTAVFTEQEYPINQFLDKIDFEKRVKEIKNNTSTFTSFKKRFFQFFDAFQLMKCLHYIREHGYEDQELSEVLPKYFELIKTQYGGNLRDDLERLREVDRS